MKNNFFKRLSTSIAAVLLLASFSGCENGVVQSSASEFTETETTSEITETETTFVVQEEMRDIPSVELVKEIKIGWSLGNSLDSVGGSGVDSETSWGNILTTKEMITAVKDAGFNTVRIPTTWGPHMDENNIVDEAWMDRVQEIVDYAYSQDMFVILNIHHEEWHDTFYDTADESIEKLTALWTQIGTRFADYDEKLIFEGLNEPRKRNTNMEWNGGDKEGHDVVNRFNAAFVSTIRNLGGNNEKRHLMIPTYAANSSEGAIADFVLPENDDKLIVSIHAYLPYEFALGGDLKEREFTPGEGNSIQITNLMSTLKTSFIDKGIPVIIGECGARGKANEDIRAQWAEYYISQAKAIGVPCIIWDNGAVTGSGENFGLLNRATCTWHYPKIIEGFMKGLE